MTPGQYAGQPNYSGQTANVIDDEVIRISNEQMERAKKIIEEHREQHKTIAEALLQYETLDEKQILSLYNTGKMPSGASNEFPSEKEAATFEESKKALERKEAEKKAEHRQNDDQTSSSDQTETFYPHEDDHHENDS